LDGIFSLGLIKRLYDLPHRFVLRVRYARKAIILGAPIARDASLSQCFIIDNTKYGWNAESAGSNIMLCDDSFELVTCLLADVFDLDIPDNILDALYDITIGNLEPNSPSERIFLAWLLSNMKIRESLVEYVRRSEWSNINRWYTEYSSTPLAERVRSRAKQICKSARPLSLGINLIRFTIANRVEYYAARLALVQLRPSSRIVIGVGINKRGYVDIIYMASNKNLIRLSQRLEEYGYLAIGRPHFIRIMFPDGKASLSDITTEFMSILRREIKKLR